MRIAILSTPFLAVPPVAYGGTERVVEVLVDGLAARGHEVFLYATGDSRGPARIHAHYPKAVWPPNPVRELVHVLDAVCDLRERLPVDVIHAHTAPALAFANMLEPPIVYTIHHDRDEALCDLYRFVRGHVTMVAISDSQRQQLADTCPAKVVPHGLDVEAYPLGDGTGGHAAFVGRFARAKGVHVAIDVARAAGVPLLVAGRAHEEGADYYRTEIAPRLEQPGVSWIGEVSQGPKVTLFGSAVATLFPIAWEEPFGLVMIESMLCGAPVLAFPRGAVPEVVDEGVTGFLMRSENEMSERLRDLAAHPGVFDRARCRAHAKRRFGADAMVDAYLEVYRAAIAHRS